MQETDRERPPAEGEPARWLREFLALNRRRQGGEALSAAERTRWEELRDLLEDCQGTVPPGPGERRRRSLRVRAHLKALVSDRLAQELLLVHELSEHGLFLRTQRPLPAGSSLCVELQNPGGGSLALEASVIWVRSEGEGHGPAGMGVAFHALSECERGVLSGLVEAALESFWARARRGGDIHGSLG